MFVAAQFVYPEITDLFKSMCFSDKSLIPLIKPILLSINCMTHGVTNLSLTCFVNIIDLGIFIL